MAVLVWDANGNPLVWAEQEVVRLGFGFEDVAFEVFPERQVGDRDFANLLTLGEDRQPTPLVIAYSESPAACNASP
jgi:hypothetical protein